MASPDFQEKRFSFPGDRADLSHVISSAVGNFKLGSGEQVIGVTYPIKSIQTGKPGGVSCDFYLVPSADTNYPEAEMDLLVGAVVYSDRFRRFTVLFDTRRIADDLTLAKIESQVSISRLQDRNC